MPSQHVEIERKFDVPPSFALPDLSSLPGVAAGGGPEERDLEAVYYDTADLRLARARVTLRRRTGGPDAGWHVKLPMTAGARRELQSPLGRATRTPPKAVQAPVRGVIGTALLGPVATLHTRRLVTSLCDAAGRVLVEVAEDAVTATAMAAGPGEPATVVTWREVEAELVDGDEELLDAVGRRLVQAGATPSASASKLSRVLAPRLAGLPGAGAGRRGGKRRRKSAGAVVVGALEKQVDALHQADLLVRTDQHGVHQLRVASRRLRSILAAFRPVLDRAQTDPVRAELRWLGQELSHVRDGEVALGHLRELVAGQPDELVLGPVAARLQQGEIQNIEAGRVAAHRALDEVRYLRLVDTLVDLLNAPPLTAAADEPAAPVLAHAIHRSAKQFLKRVEAARPDHDGVVVHDVRKAAKTVRYTAEVAEPALGKRAKRATTAMKQVQELLGDRQDTIVTREFCRTIGLAAEAAGENAWTYGRLHALEEARAETASAAFWALEPSLARTLRRAAR